jgi:eukaryotic-like serine/threonine-protein kinase
MRGPRTRVDAVSGGRPCDSGIGLFVSHATGRRTLVVTSDVVASVEADVRVVGRYAIHDTIASGGMATVRFGRLLGQAGFSRTVAIKCLYPPFATDPEFVAMFLDEARLVARIRSPYVVPAIDVVALEGELFIVMEYVAGESLARLLRPSPEARPNPPIPVDIAVSIMCEVLEGLHAAHETRSEQGEPLHIVHRDVSPQNILVGTDGLGHVIDFGVAKAAGRMQTTRDGQLKGKLAYMAPEQLRGESVTRRSDVYAASVVLWEALTGERLFRADDEGAVVTRVLMGALVPPSQGGTRGRDADALRALEQLDDVVMRGLNRVSAARFETAREMGVALQKCVTPASPARVSEWLEQVAGATIAARAARLAQIESGLSAASKTKGPGSLELATIPEGLGPQEIEVDRPNQTTTQASSISVVSSVTSAPRRRRAWWLIASIPVVTAIFFAGYLAQRVTLNAHPAIPVSGPPPVESASSVAASAPSAAASTEPVASASAAAPVASEAARQASHPARPPVPATKRLSAPAVSECDPPFTWDARGKKIYKRNCL